MKQALNAAYLADLIEILKQAGDALADASYHESDLIRYYDYRTASMEFLRAKMACERVLYHIARDEEKNETV